jgi:hypothetical protein
MSSSISTFHGTGGVSPEALDKALKDKLHLKPKAQGGGQYLRLGRNDGVWSFGPENIDVEEESRWAANAYSLRSGFVAWADPKHNNNKREKLGEVMGSFSNPPDCPDIDHSDKGGVWQEQIGLDLKCITGEDKDEAVSYGSSSLGGKAAYSYLYEKILDRPQSTFCHPVVELGERHYENKAYGGVTYVPIFDIVDWADDDENLLSDGVPKQLEEGVSKAANENASTAQETDASEAPKRRRRRQQTD